MSPEESASSPIIRSTSAQLRIGVWRRVSRGVAHDLLNAAMPLRSLGTPVPEGTADAEARSQLAQATGARITGLGMALHRLEASIRSDREGAEGGWPLFREMIRWAVPRGVRIKHDDGDRIDLGSELESDSADLVFWAAAFCGELVEPESGEIAIDSTPDALLLRLPRLRAAPAGAVEAEARRALEALEEAGLIEWSAAGGEASIVRIPVIYRGGVEAPAR